MGEPPRAPETDRIASLFARQRANQAAVKRCTAADRVAKLRKLRDAIKSRAPAIRDALAQDFRKAPAESDVTEIVPVLVELKQAIAHLKSWMRPRRVATPLSMLGTRSWVRSEPKGVVLIIGAWNYPFQLVMAPLIAAVAAGNCVIVKPSEVAGHASRLLAELIGATFAEDEVAVVEGGVAETTPLLALPFDHFFFTGSTRVGRIVAAAAAKHLASTTLELGGKSPAIVDDSADLHTASRRIAWGKWVNGGQTCIAPDYVLVSAARQQALVGALQGAIEAMYGATDDARRQSADFCRIIDTRNYDRLKKMLDDATAAGAEVAFGGATDAGERYIAPTILTNVAPGSSVMAEEIFGPILPVLTYQSFDEVVPFVTARDKPLALYVFAADEARVEQVIANTTAGGTCINTTLVHFVNHNLPFGGTGPSGLGSYHGWFGFKAFSHERAVLRQGRLVDMFQRIYPPYTSKVGKVLALMKRLFT